MAADKPQWQGDKLYVPLPQATYYSFALQHGYAFLLREEVVALRDALDAALQPQSPEDFV